MRKSLSGQEKLYIHIKGSNLNKILLQEDKFANAYMDVNPDYVSDRVMQSRNMRNSRKDKGDFRRQENQHYQHNNGRNQRK